jgi:hypothetical protein
MIWTTGQRASAGAWQRLQLWSAVVDNPKPPPQFWAQASCSPAGLDVRFRLIWTPADATVMVPQQNARDSSGPERRDGLWQHTCFEVFAGLVGSDSYWEINLSPSGDWNVYRFSGYRSGQAPELAYGQLPLTVIGPRAAPPVADCRLGAPRALLELELCCPLPPPLHERLQSGTAPALELGLSAVLEGREGELSYWALQHPGIEPDFHDRRGWLLRL